MTASPRLICVPVRPPSSAAIQRAVGDMTVDGTIRLLFIREAGRVGLVQTAHEPVLDADQFLVRYVERMIADVAAPAVVVAVHRRDGRPTYADRQLWSMLGERLEPAPTALLDLVITGGSRLWSMRRGKPLSAARRSASRASAR